MKMETDITTPDLLSAEREIRKHKIQFWQEITMALACLVFFFVGAPLGAIIRKGGLGLPVVMSVIIFIVYYIINTGGMKLAREGSIPVWIGMWASTIVLAPLGVFFTVKSNNDSVVFNYDSYVQLFRKLWGIPQKRHIVRKEVIIHDPDYDMAERVLGSIGKMAHTYRRTHHLRRFPNYISLFFRSERDEEVVRISEALEACVEHLSNSKDRQILLLLNYLPVLDPYAHTAPFKNRKWNIAAGVIFPVGLILLFRVSRFRHRLRKYLKLIYRTCDRLQLRINEMQNEGI